MYNADNFSFWHCAFSSCTNGLCRDILPLSSFPLLYQAPLVTSSYRDLFPLPSVASYRVLGKEGFPVAYTGRSGDLVDRSASRWG